MSRRPDPANLRQQAFLRAAAVLWQFAPDALQPDSDDRSAAGEVASLLPFVVRIRTAGGDRWTLRDTLRPELLRGADTSELARLRARNPTTDSREQQRVDRWLAGPDAELAAYDCEALAILSRILTWFDPVPPHFPSIDRLDRLRALARVREPLLELAGRGIRGRTHELGQLHGFVAGTPGAGAPAILVVHGIGGVGKSTLTAQFLLDVLASGDPSHLVAYLDFDHPTLDVNDGLTLMFEILRQGATQLPEHACLRDLVRRASQATVDLSAGRGRAPGRALAVRASMAELAASCGQAFKAAGAAKLTLVLDTLEEPQYANPDHQRQLGEQLGIFHAHLPGLHTIVISRAPLALPGAQQLELTDLDDAAARQFLGDHGVRDEAVVRSALQAARGNPFSLKLATRALESSAAEPPLEVTDRGDGAARRPVGDHGVHDDALVRTAEPSNVDRHAALEHALVHGQLYQRILAHVHEAEIRQLAHPGLVVRRVTAPLLQHVLAEPCGLGMIDADRADELFAGLAREVALVRVADVGALEHRADVRRVMLRLMYRDRPAIARRIHEQAADYHRDRHDDVAIVEEAYHRLALGETFGPWLVRLTQAAAQRLVTALDELPEAAWPIVATCAGIELSPERRQAVQTAALERDLAQQARELLRGDHAESALALLERTRPSGGSSVLWRWRGRALRGVGRLAEALVALERSLAALAGPAVEAREDLALALALAGALGDTDSLARLEPGRSPGAAAARGSAGSPRAAGAYPGSVRPTPDEPMTRAPSPAQWLDDQDLRAVLEAAIDHAEPEADAEPRDAALDGSVAAAPRSTRAASAYAKAVTLNRRVVDNDKYKDTGPDLFDWVDALSKSHRDLDAIRGSLKSRLSPK